MYELTSKLYTLHDDTKKRRGGVTVSLVCNSIIAIYLAILYSPSSTTQALSPRPQTRLRGCEVEAEVARTPLYGNSSLVSAKEPRQSEHRDNIFFVRNCDRNNYYN